VVPRNQPRLIYERRLQSHPGLVTELRVTTHAVEWPLRVPVVPQPEKSLGGLHRRTSPCVGPPEQIQECGVPPALRDGPSRHPLRGAARTRRGGSRFHPLDTERYPRRMAGYRHRRDHHPDPAKSEGAGRGAYRAEIRQDRARVVLLGSALAVGPVGHPRTTRTLPVSRGVLSRLRTIRTERRLASANSLLASFRDHLPSATFGG
jgi:hypothetical protein